MNFFKLLTTLLLCWGLVWVMPSPYLPIAFVLSLVFVLFCEFPRAQRKK